MNTDIKHLVECAVTLTPVYYRDAPEIKVGVNGFVSPYTLTKTTTYSFRFFSFSSCTVDVEFCNKNPHDTDVEKNLDKAVIVESVEFFGIKDARFAWAGVYQPHGMSPMPAHTYLSWNGTWCLKFDVPVFEWMHKTQGLGWIYQ